MSVHKMTVLWNEKTGEIRLEGSAPNNVVALGMLSAGMKLLDMKPTQPNANLVTVRTMPKIGPNGR